MTTAVRQDDVVIQGCAGGGTASPRAPHHHPPVVPPSYIPNARLMNFQREILVSSENGVARSDDEDAQPAKAATSNRTALGSEHAAADSRSDVTGRQISTHHFLKKWKKCSYVAVAPRSGSSGRGCLLSRTLILRVLPGPRGPKEGGVLRSPADASCCGTPAGRGRSSCGIRARRHGGAR